jgi:ParB/RepB/Spo0J family partition protein
MTDKHNPNNIDRQPVQGTPIVEAYVEALVSASRAPSAEFVRSRIRQRMLERGVLSHYEASRLHRGDRHVETIEIPLGNISKARIRNSRQDDSEDDFRRLVESISREGMLNPITVQRDPHLEGRYILLAGSRRLHAAAELGWRTIRASVVECEGPCDAHMVNLLENLGRRDLSTWELASALEHMQGLGLSVNELAQRTGYTEQYVYQLLSFLKISLPIVEAWRQRHALLTLPCLQRLKAAGVGALDLWAKLQSRHTREEGKPLPTIQTLLEQQLTADDPDHFVYATPRRRSHARLNKLRDHLLRGPLPTDPKKVRDMAVGIVDYARGVTKNIPGLIF